VLSGYQGEWEKGKGAGVVGWEGGGEDYSNNSECDPRRTGLSSKSVIV